MDTAKTPRRRTFLTATLAAFASGSAWSAAFPDRPIKLLLPVAPGSAVDATARRLAPLLEGSLGQPLVLENRPGSAGIIATTQLLRSPADGYTVAMVASTHCITPHLHKTPYHPLRDVQPVVALTSGPLLLVVHEAFPARDVRQFIAHAKARPESRAVTIGNPGNGTPLHVAAALMALKADFKALHVAYKGLGAFATDLAGGQVEAGFLPVVSALPLIKTGQLRVLGFSTPTRVAALPNVPTIAESGLAGFDIDSWVAMIAAKGVPREVVERINAEVNKALKRPDLERFIADSGGSVLGGSIKQCEELFRRDFTEYGHVIAQAGIKAD